VSHMLESHAINSELVYIQTANLKYPFIQNLHTQNFQQICIDNHNQTLYLLEHLVNTEFVGRILINKTINSFSIFV
jgi:hypothetical protein